jgi:RecB family exonuclease
MAWSVSRAALWRECPLHYYLRYVAKATPSQPVSSALMHGRLVHTGLQAAYESARDTPVAPGAMMSAHCPPAHEAITAYTDRDGAEITARWRRDAMGEVESLLEALRAPVPGAVLGVETSFELVVDGVTVRGVLDLALLTGARSVHIRDWKTGALPEDIGLNPQLGTYHRAARTRWAFATKVTVGLYNTRRHEEISDVFAPETEAFVLDRLVSHYRDAAAVSEAVRHGRRSVREGYPARAGEHCASCDCRSYCPLFADVSLPVRDETVVRQESKRVHELINQS